MPCPWYQYGLCTSPKLSEPTDAIVSVDRCSSENLYINCAYFEEVIDTSTSRRHVSRKDKPKLYVPIHAIPSHVDSACPACETNTTENGIKVMYCKILDRYLTKHEAYVCSKYWKDCPYRELETL
uniref:Uncharacterized protein n=1 Tax=Ignisphaera aggregans TaxID=334771 RepID=A0A7C2ZPZ3_9CREN